MNHGHLSVPGSVRLLWLLLMQPVTLKRVAIDEHRPKELGSPTKGSPGVAVLRKALLMALLPLIGLVAWTGYLLSQDNLLLSWFNVLMVVLTGSLVGAMVTSALTLGYDQVPRPKVLAFYGLGMITIGLVLLFNVEVQMTSPPVPNCALDAELCPDTVAAPGDTRDPLRLLAIVSTALFLFRVPIFFLECLVDVVSFANLSLRWCSPLYNELSFFPLPFLAAHILRKADDNPMLTRRVLTACSISPGQRRIGLKVEAHLRARELRGLAARNDFQAIAELRGQWLPGTEGADPILLAFSQAGRYLQAASAVFSPHHQLDHLNNLEAHCLSIENQLRANRNAFTQPYEETLAAIRAIASRRKQEAEKQAEGLIPNPFRAEDPLSHEEGPELFRGREQARREIEDIVSDRTRSGSLQLLAPRRSGKTTMLKMLPQLLPDTVCVFFDLQKHPASSIESFWTSLAKEARTQARSDRRIELPPFPSGPPLEAAAQWLEQLDQLPSGRRVLIAIDEFERMENLFPGNRQQFLQLMGLFRATIQHRRGVRLLVSGAAPFDELDGVWDDHFISVRQVRLPFLDKETSIGLLTRPTRDFPAGTIPEDVAAEVYQLTGGQPYLLQIFGSVLVNHLNDTRHAQATLADVADCEARVIEWAENYFRDMYRSAPADVKQALKGEREALTPQCRRWMQRRYLLREDGAPAIPLFVRWLESYALV